MTHRIAGLFELVIWSVLLNILFGLALWAVARRLTRDRLGALGMCLLMASVLTLILGRLASAPAAFSHPRMTRAAPRVIAPIPSAMSAFLPNR